MDECIELNLKTLNCSFAIYLMLYNFAREKWGIPGGLNLKNNIL
jgi:hypothetical protein